MAELSRGQILKNPEVIGAGTTGAKIRLLDADENSHIDIKVPDTVGTAYTFTLPSDDGIVDYYLKTDGNGNTSWAAVSASPGGTTRQIQYNNAGAFAGAAVTTDGTNFYVTAGSQLRFNDSDNSNYVGFAASSVVSANRSYTLPDTVGSAGQVLKIASSPAPTSTSASLIWATDETGGAGASPGGSDTFIQFNDAGTFGGDAGFTYNKTTDSATLSGSLTVGVGVSSSNHTINISQSIGFYAINGTSVLNSTTLGSGVTNSSLTSVGTLTNLTVSNSLTVGVLTASTNTIISNSDIILDPVTTNPVRIAGGSPLRLFGSTTPNDYVGLAVPASVTSSYTITLPAASPVVDGSVLQLGTNGTGSFVSNTKTLNYVIDGGGTAIATGIKGVVILDAAYTLTAWTVYGDSTGAINVDVGRAAAPTYPRTSAATFSTIVSPNLGATEVADRTTGLNISISSGDTLQFNVTSNTGAHTRLTVALRLLPV